MRGPDLSQDQHNMLRRFRIASRGGSVFQRPSVDDGVSTLSPVAQKALQDGNMDRHGPGLDTAVLHLLYWEYFDGIPVRCELQGRLHRTGLGSRRMARRSPIKGCSRQQCS
jgi:hypothetical protein